MTSTAKANPQFIAIALIGVFGMPTPAATHDHGPLERQARLDVFLGRYMR